MRSSTTHDARWKGKGMRRSAVIVAAVLSLLVAGCADPEETARQTPAKAGEEAKPVIVGTGANISEGNFFILENGDFPATKGVKLQPKVVLFDLGLQGVEAAIAGQTNAGVSVELPMLRFINDDADTVAVGVVMTAQDIEVIVKNNIKTPQDLVGKTIGLPQGSNMDYAFQRYLEHHNITPSDVKVINVAPAEMVATLARNDIDGFVFVEPIVSRAFEALQGKIEYLQPTMDEVHTSRLWLQFNRKWAEQNHDVVQATLASLIEADKLVDSKPDEAFGLVAKKLNLKPEDVASGYKKAGYDWNVYIDDEAVKGIETVAEFMVSKKLIPSVPDYKSHIDPSYLKAVDPARVTVTE
jgi:ABC-type nitrate/sulfonate/bicarbonate transport system substrate-binding protein